ncbi:MAG TPA: TerC family protein [Burkholderiales bacterium]|nr:TerC family protein [Burkholderiales bacterium]
MEWLFTPEGLIALATLTALELVLGIDNVIFISILAGKLPPGQRDNARRLGLLVAAVSRLALLFSIAWIIGLTDPLFALLGQEISWRDIILITGGLFLIYKGTSELHQRLEGETGVKGAAVRATFAGVLLQVFILDMVFALDSIITAVGMVDDVGIMAAAIILSVALMLLAAKYIHGFVERHPTIKVLALSFLLMIGMVLIADGLEVKVPKGYVYFAMGFSVFVELLNMRMRKVQREAPVRLHDAYAQDDRKA